MARRHSASLITVVRIHEIGGRRLSETPENLVLPSQSLAIMARGAEALSDCQALDRRLANICAQGMRGSVGDVTSTRRGR